MCGCLVTRVRKQASQPAEQSLSLPWSLSFLSLWLPPFPLTLPYVRPSLPPSLPPSLCPSPKWNTYLRDFSSSNKQLSTSLLSPSILWEGEYFTLSTRHGNEKHTGELHKWQKLIKGELREGLVTKSKDLFWLVGFYENHYSLALMGHESRSQPFHPTFWGEMCRRGSIMRVSYEKPRSSHCVMKCFWWGCWGNFGSVAALGSLFSDGTSLCVAALLFSASGLLFVCLAYCFVDQSNEILRELLHDPEIWNWSLLGVRGYKQLLAEGACTAMFDYGERSLCWALHQVKAP